MLSNITNKQSQVIQGRSSLPRNNVRNYNQSTVNNSVLTENINCTIDNSYIDDNSLIIKQSKKNDAQSHNKRNQQKNVNFNIDKKQDIFLTEEWLIKSQRQQNVRNSNTQRNEKRKIEESGNHIKSVNESDQSDYKLREENMVLRQEILKLQKVQYMNDQNQNDDYIHQQTYSKTKEVSPHQKFDASKDTHNDCDFIFPQSDVPKPYHTKPQKPEIFSTQNSDFQQSKNLMSSSFRLNLLENTDLDCDVNDQHQLSIHGDSVDIKLNDKFDDENIVNRQSYDTNLHPNQLTRTSQSKQLKFIRQNKQPISLKQDDSLLLSQLNNISQSRIIHNESNDQKDLEDLIKAEGIHIRKSFMDDNQEGFNEKKRNSSVFEIQRHYEDEIQNLKRDLEMMQKEEIKLKAKMDKKNLPPQKEFTFKSANEKKLLGIEASINNQQNTGKQSKDSKSNQFNYQTVKDSKISKETKIIIKDQGRKCQFIDKEQQIHTKQVQPPSFNNSQTNTHQNSPKLPTNEKSQNYRNKSIQSFHRQNQGLPNLNSQESYDYSKYDNQRLDTDVIDQIFEDKTIQEQFRCLDINQYQSQDSSQLINQEAQFKRYNNNDSESHSNSQNENSCCEKNYQNELQAILKGRDLDKVQDEYIKDSIKDLFKKVHQKASQKYQPDEIISSGDYVVESPKSKRTKIYQQNHYKDSSPSFGLKSDDKVIYDSKNNSNSKTPHQHSSEHHQYVRQCCHQRKSSQSFINELSYDLRDSKIFSNGKMQYTVSKKKKDQQSIENKSKYQSNIHQKKNSVHEMSTIQVNANNNEDQLQLSYNGRSANKAEKKIENIQKMSQSKSQSNLQSRLYKSNDRPFNQNLNTSSDDNVLQSEQYIGNSFYTNREPLSKANKSGYMNQSVINPKLYESNLSNIYETNYNNKSSNIDAEYLYDIRTKSAMKKRDEMQQKKENTQRSKLNEKLAKIEALQKQKEERKSSILEKRYSKSPVENVKYTSAIHKKINPIMNYISISQDEKYQRTPEARTPNNREASQRSFNNNTNSQPFMTIFNNVKNDHSTSKDSCNKSNVSKNTSCKITGQNTPITSTRKNYYTNPTASMNKNLNCSSSSFFDQRDSSNFEHSSPFLSTHNQQKNTFSYNQLQHNSTANFFKRSTQPTDLFSSHQTIHTTHNMSHYTSQNSRQSSPLSVQQHTSSVCQYQQSKLKPCTSTKLIRPISSMLEKQKTTVNNSQIMTSRQKGMGVLKQKNDINKSQIKYSSSHNSTINYPKMKQNKSFINLNANNIQSKFSGNVIERFIKKNNKLEPIYED